MAVLGKWLQGLRRWRFAPILASVTVVSTLVACFIITRVKRRYTGGLVWPYFSDMGRDPPSYYVFGVGLSLAAIAIALTWVFNFEYHGKRFATVAPVARPTAWAYCVSYSVLILGVLSTIGLPVLGWCSTTACPVIHNVGTFWFFILELVAILLNTCLSYYIWKVLWVAYTKADHDTDHNYRAHTDRDDRLERGQQFVPPTPLLARMHVAPANVYGIKWAFFWQLVCALLLLATALVYIPIGLAVVGHVPRLSVQQCLDRELGFEYCTSTMRLSPNDTKLWNYELKPKANQLRAACQLAAMLSLVGYSLSYLFHDYTVVAAPHHDDPPSSRTPLTSPSARRESR